MIHTNRPIPIEEIRLLVFDLDGTLIDSRLDLTNSINAMLRHFQRPELPEEVISTYIGDGAPMLVRRALGDPDDQKFFDEALLYFLSYYREHKLDNTYVYAGIHQALKAIRESGNGNSPMQMAVLTNKPIVPSRAIIEGLDLQEFFFQIYGGNSFSTKKPDPLGARTLLHDAGVNPEQAAMIGDSANDVLTGRNSGMWTIGLTYGLAPHSLQEAPPDVLLDHPAELQELFVSVNRTVPHRS